MFSRQQAKEQREVLRSRLWFRENCLGVYFLTSCSYCVYVRMWCKHLLVHRRRRLNNWSNYPHIRWEVSPQFSMRKKISYQCKQRQRSSSPLLWFEPARVLNPCNACRWHGWLKLTASAFNQLKLVCKQSWLQGTLLRRARRFFPICGRNHHPYSLHLPRRDGQAEWVWINTCHFNLIQTWESNL